MCIPIQVEKTKRRRVERGLYVHRQHYFVLTFIYMLKFNIREHYKYRFKSLLSVCISLFTEKGLCIEHSLFCFHQNQTCKKQQGINNDLIMSQPNRVLLFIVWNTLLLQHVLRQLVNFLLRLQLKWQQSAFYPVNSLRAGGGLHDILKEWPYLRCSGVRDL